MAQTGYHEPFFWHRIANVGWGGAWGLLNFRRVSGNADPVLVLASAARSDFTGGLPPENLVQKNWSIGEIIDNDLWNDDDIGIRSFILVGGSFSGQIANFKVLDSQDVHGLIIGSSAVTGGTNSYEVDLLIYSGGENRIAGESGEFPQFANDGGALLYSDTRSFTVPPNFSQVFFHFNKTGFFLV